MLVQNYGGLVSCRPLRLFRVGGDGRDIVDGITEFYNEINEVIR